MLKLKISPQFLQDRFKILLVCLGIIFAPKAFSKTTGLVQSLEDLLKIHRDQYSSINEKVSGNTKALATLPEAKEIKLDPYYLKSLIFHSSEDYLQISANDQCLFYGFLENDLLKSTMNDSDEVIALITDKNDKTFSTKLSKKDFFTEVYRRTCQNNKEFNILFKDDNIIKTLERLTFPIPNSEKSCQKILLDWRSNPYIPYICRVAHLLKNPVSKKENLYLAERSTLYKTKLTPLQKNYLENLCGNLTSEERFCVNYLKNDVWNKITNGELPLYKMQYKCSSILDRPMPLSKNDLNACAFKLNQQPVLCSLNGNIQYPALFPNPDCNDQSSLLLESNLVTEYHDCPGLVDNEGIVNFHRIVMHFKPRAITSTPQNCAEESNYTFATTNLAVGNETAWPMKICFMNRIQNKEDCTVYVPGTRKEEKLSEDKVMSKILYTYYGAGIKTTCTIVDSVSYNPLRSDYKSGCFIIYDKENCTTLECNKKVSLDGKEISSIKYSGAPLFDYFPSSFMNERYAITNLFKETLGLQQKSIRNLTDLKNFLTMSDKNIIHGIGCAEDLIPENFKRTGLNQCRPLPFIIDSFNKKGDQELVGARFAVTDLHSPRTLKWSFIFNAVSNYREIHPLNTWTLYGLKK